MNTIDRTPHRILKATIKGLALLACCVTLAGTAGCGDEAEAALDYKQIPTSPVRRGDLVVKVTKGGTLQAMESLIIKSELDGRFQITEVVEEGTVLTKQDVENERVLVRLDTSELEEKETNRTISFQKAEAALRQAEEDLEIQKKDNVSNVASARLKAKFGRMELERYVGRDLATVLIEGESDVDFEKLASDERLKGQARQELRQKSADVTLAQEELDRAIKTRDDTARLEKEGYVSRNELETDELTVKRRRIELERAIEERRLFQVYTLPKEAEKRLSDYQEALREVDKAESRARAQLAQKKSQLDARKVTFEREQERLEETRDQITKGVIRATQPGLVVYSSTTSRWRRRSGNMVEVGAEVWHGLPILEIPNLNTLAARVDIHETDINRVKIGQRAEITIEALPEDHFEGEVVSKAPMAKSQSWHSQDVRVYETDVKLDLSSLPDALDSSDLNPGMSATVEIIVAELDEVLYVPIQAVSTYKGDRICWVKTDTAPEIRKIETGHFTNTHVEILKGLEKGEEVYMAPATELDRDEEQREMEENGQRDEDDAEEPATQGNEPTGSERKAEEPETEEDADADSPDQSETNGETS